MDDQLKKIEALLKEHNVPKEVFIGTDSTADRVEWLCKRVALVEAQRKAWCDETMNLKLSLKKLLLENVFGFWKRMQSMVMNMEVGYPVTSVEKEKMLAICSTCVKNENDQELATDKESRAAAGWEDMRDAAFTASKAKEKKCECESPNPSLSTKDYCKTCGGTIENWQRLFENSEPKSHDDDEQG